MYKLTRVVSYKTLIVAARKHLSTRTQSIVSQWQSQYSAGSSKHVLSETTSQLGVPVWGNCCPCQAVWSPGRDLLYTTSTQSRHKLWAANWALRVTKTTLTHRIVTPWIHVAVCTGLNTSPAEKHHQPYSSLFYNLSVVKLHSSSI